MTTFQSSAGTCLQLPGPPPDVDWCLTGLAGMGEKPLKPRRYKVNSSRWRWWCWWPSFVAEWMTVSLCVHRDGVVRHLPSSVVGTWEMIFFSSCRICRLLPRIVLHPRSWSLPNCADDRRTGCWWSAGPIGTDEWKYFFYKGAVERGLDEVHICLICIK